MQDDDEHAVDYGENDIPPEQEIPLGLEDDGDDAPPPPVHREGPHTGAHSPVVDDGATTFTAVLNHLNGEIVAESASVTDDVRISPDLPGAPIRRALPVEADVSMESIYDSKSRDDSQEGLDAPLSRGRSPSSSTLQSQSRHERRPDADNSSHRRHRTEPGMGYRNGDEDSRSSSTFVSQHPEEDVQVRTPHLEPSGQRGRGMNRPPTASHRGRGRGNYHQSTRPYPNRVEQAPDISVGEVPKLSFEDRHYHPGDYNGTLDDTRPVPSTQSQRRPDARPDTGNAYDLQTSEMTRPSGRRPPGQHDREGSFHRSSRVEEFPAQETRQAPRRGEDWNRPSSQNLSRSQSLHREPRPQSGSGQLDSYYRGPNASSNGWSSSNAPRPRTPPPPRTSGPPPRRPPSPHSDPGVDQNFGGPPPSRLTYGHRPYDAHGPPARERPYHSDRGPEPGFKRSAPPDVDMDEIEAKRPRREAQYDGNSFPRRGNYDGFNPQDSNRRPPRDRPQEREHSDVNGSYPPRYVGQHPPSSNQVPVSRPYVEDRMDFAQTRSNGPPRQLTRPPSPKRWDHGGYQDQHGMQVESAYNQRRPHENQVPPRREDPASFRQPASSYEAPAPPLYKEQVDSIRDSRPQDDRRPAFNDSYEEDAGYSNMQRRPSDRGRGRGRGGFERPSRFQPPRPGPPIEADFPPHPPAMNQSHSTSPTATRNYGPPAQPFRPRPLDPAIEANLTRVIARLNQPPTETNAPDMPYNQAPPPRRLEPPALNRRFSHGANDRSEMYNQGPRNDMSGQGGPREHPRASRWDTPKNNWNDPHPTNSQRPPGPPDREHPAPRRSPLLPQTAPGFTGVASMQHGVERQPNSRLAHDDGGHQYDGPPRYNDGPATSPLEARLSDSYQTRRDSFSQAEHAPPPNHYGRDRHPPPPRLPAGPPQGFANGPPEPKRLERRERQPTSPIQNRSNGGRPNGNPMPFGAGPTPPEQVPRPFENRLPAFQYDPPAEVPGSMRPTLLTRLSDLPSRPPPMDSGYPSEENSNTRLIDRVQGSANNEVEYDPYGGSAQRGRWNGRGRTNGYQHRGRGRGVYHQG